MKRYCNVEPILHLLSDKDLLESVNVGAVLQALQHGLYNGEVAPVVHAKRVMKYYAMDLGYFVPKSEVFKVNSMIKNIPFCGNCGERLLVRNQKYCHACGAKMDEKEGNL